jgi:hypothetical protein
MDSKDRCYSYDEINEELLTKFSEGSKSLESLLKFCYQYKIKTVACCAGHEEEGITKTPYIYFNIDEDQHYIIENLINRLFSIDDISKYIKINISKESIVIEINSFDKEIRESVFNIIEGIFYDSIIRNINMPGIYDGLLEVCKQITHENKSRFNITSNGLNISECQEMYFVKRGNEIIEIPSSQILNKSELENSISFDSYTVVCSLNPNEIEEYISSQRNKSKNSK